MIRAVEIDKSFGNHKVLHQISTSFKPGECSLIIGASGSGKTVLLKSLVGLHEIDSGEIWYEDTRFDTLPLKGKKDLRKEIGMLFQGSALFDFATVEENVRFPMDFFTDWSTKQKIDRVNFCLERVDLKGVNSLYPSELSGGMQKRVGIARAIALNPKYLFCDEPNSGLDPQTAILIDRLIYEITEDYGIITIINTHDMNSAIEIGDRVSFVYQGKLLWEGDGESLFDSGCPELHSFVTASGVAKK